MILSLTGSGFEIGSGVRELTTVDMTGSRGRFSTVMRGGGFDPVWAEYCLRLDSGVGFAGELTLRGFGFGFGLGCRGGLAVR